MHSIRSSPSALSALVKSEGAVFAYMKHEKGQAPDHIGFGAGAAGAGAGSGMCPGSSGSTVSWRTG